MKVNPITGKIQRRYIRRTPLAQRLIKQHGKGIVKSLVAAIQSDPIPLLRADAVASVFYWRDTPQGSTFWGNIDDLDIQYIDKQLNKSRGCNVSVA